MLGKDLLWHISWTSDKVSLNWELTVNIFYLPSWYLAIFQHSSFSSSSSSSSSSSYRIRFCILFSACSFIMLTSVCFGDRPGGLRVFGFLFFAIFANWLSSIVFTWSLHARALWLWFWIILWIIYILDLADVANSIAKFKILRGINRVSFSFG